MAGENLPLRFAIGCIASIQGSKKNPPFRPRAARPQSSPLYKGCKIRIERENEQNPPLRSARCATRRRSPFTKGAMSRMEHIIKILLFPLQANNASGFTPRRRGVRKKTTAQASIFEQERKKNRLSTQSNSNRESRKTPFRFKRAQSSETVIKKLSA